MRSSTDNMSVGSSAGTSLAWSPSPTCPFGSSTTTVSLSGTHSATISRGRTGPADTRPAETAMVASITPLNERRWIGQGPYRNRASQWAAVRRVQPGALAPPGGAPTHRDGHRLLLDPGVHPVTLKRSEQLGVLQALGIEPLRENHRGGHERSRQRSPSGLVHPGDDAEPGATKPALVVIDLFQSPDNHRKFEGGQMRMNASPTTLSLGMGPREDRE